MTIPLLGAFQATEHLRHTRPADAQVTGQASAVLDHPGIEEALVESGKTERIAVNTCRPGEGQRIGFWAVPGVKLDEGGAT
ncbi:MAG: hypothetical protein L0Z62_45940 [Gemmataceae bacterium]|nr:hypothetical protein [Gemmataceae bacterium]